MKRSTTDSRRRARRARPVPAAVFALAVLPALLIACSSRKGGFAYTGRMDVDPIILSAQASGVIDSLPVKEGDAVRRGEVLGQINTDRLQAQRREQEAQLAELDVRKSAAEAQIRQAEAQLRFTQDTLAKTERLLAEGGATRQRRDELATQATVGEQNLAALQSNIKLIAAQEDALGAGIDLTDIAIRDARIVSPINGIILDKFHYQGELAAMGTPLLELADLEELTVEIYVPLAALGSVKIGEAATVSVEGISQRFAGRVIWIASEAEFTPKTILTQETQTTLVYGVKIRVPNPDGILKIGMPVEVGL